MIGEILAKIRKEKNIRSFDVCKETKLDMGHFSHIETEKRNPSLKAVKSICNAINTPFMPLMNLFDYNLTEDQRKYKVIEHLEYNKIPAFDSISSYIQCPGNMPNASMALKIKDNSMAPLLNKNSYAYIALNIPLNHRDIGLFLYDNRIIIRRFLIRKNNLVLKPENKEFQDIKLSEEDDFIIIGKILGTTENEKLI